MQKEAVSAPIIGVTKPHHLDDAVAALELILEKARVCAAYRCRYSLALED
jgi:aryl-alcohol dehydrogenase-like predicted oxidoreductase